MFNEPILDHLIEFATRQNLDLHAAATRIWQARSQRCIAASARFFQVDGTGSMQTTQQSLNAIGFGTGVPGFLLGPRDFWNTGFDVAWEPDFFGRITRQIQAADGNLGASVEAYRDVLVLLYGEVARTYVEIRTVQQQIDYTKKNIRIQEQSLDLAKKRVEGGVSPILDEYQATSSLASIKATLPPLETRLQQLLNQMSVLVGEYPGSLHSLLCEPRPIPAAPSSLPIVVPCDMIRQRPDIRQAERLVAARTAEVGVAITDLYPRFVLSGNIGLSSQQFGSLFESDSYTYGFGPSFRIPLIANGRIRCNIARSEAAVEEAVAIYEQTILIAVAEIEDSIVAFNKERTRLESLQTTVTASQKSLESVLELYRGGKTNFQNVLDVQRTLFLAQDAKAASEGQVVANLIRLYRALGGGWDPQHHCDHGIVRLRCPERAAPELCEKAITGEDKSAQEVPESDPSKEEKEPEALKPLPKVQPADELPSPRGGEKKRDPSGMLEANAPLGDHDSSRELTDDDDSPLRLPEIRLPANFRAFRPFSAAQTESQSAGPPERTTR